MNLRKGVRSATILSILVLAFNALSQSKLPFSPIKTVYIVPSSHYDFGFVDPPNAIRERAARHIDEVIRVAESDPEFRWTIESVWQINEWLKRQRKPSSVLPSDKEKIARLMSLIKSGRIVVSTSWGSMHTDFMGNEELNRICYDFIRLQKSFGIDSEVAYMNDVPGHPMSVASVLADSGTKYLVTGANTFISDATSLAPGKVPFYWEAPDGNKVLLWVSQGNRGAYVEAFTDFYLDPYSLDPYTDRRPFDMFNPDLIGKKSDLEIMEMGVTNLLNRYNKAGYHYDAVMAMYAHDFFEPSNVENLERAVKLWNGKHDEVKLKIATSPEFFKYIQGKYGSEIPTYRGEWSGLWSEAKTASPRISAAARYTHDHAPAAEILWSAISMLRRIPYPAGNFSSIYDLMYTYDEHSGAGNTGWPQLNSSQPLVEQNREYVGFTGDAKAETDRLLASGIKIIAQPSRYDSVASSTSDTSFPYVVYNGNSWQRSDVVRIAPPKEGLRIVGVKDLADQSPVTFDTDGDGAAIFVARDVPSLGYRSFEIFTAAGKPISTLRAAAGNSISNARYSVTARTDGTISSIRDRVQNKELVNNNGELPFNELLRVEGVEASKVLYPISPKITIRRGNVLTELVITRERSSFPTTKITLLDGIDRVELRNELDPSTFPFVGGSNNWSDSYYFAFPFNISKDFKIMRGGQKWFDTLPDDYLPGARRDSVSTQHLIGFTDGRSTAMVAHRQAYHWLYPSYVSAKLRPKGSAAELPAVFTGKFPLPEATIYSRAVRFGQQADTHDLGIMNIWTTEPGVGGNMVFEYAFSVGGAFDTVNAWRTGADFDLPLRGEYSQVAPIAAQRSFFTIDQPNVQIVDVKQVSDNVIHGEVSSAPLDPPVARNFIIRLQEFTGRATRVKIGLPVKVKAASLVSITEDKEIGNVDSVEPLTVAVRPFQTVTIKITIE
jgi:alpha-mannosidase